MALIWSSMSDNSSNKTSEGWNKAAEVYSNVFSRVTNAIARDFIDLTHKIKPIDEPDSYVLDNGAGTGAVTINLATRLTSTPVLATDISDSMMSKIRDQNLPNVQIRVVDALRLDKTLQDDTRRSEKGGFSHAFAMFVLQFVPNDATDTFINQMISVVQSGGTVGLGIWGDKIDNIDLVNQVFLEIDPNYKVRSVWTADEFPRTEPEIKRKVESMGLKNVQTIDRHDTAGFETTEQLAVYMFEGKNPAVEKLYDYWREAHPEIGIDLVREKFTETVGKELEKDKDFLRKIGLQSISVVGVKP
ncbi:hypothetical protein LTS08_007773 [Lithohypha guttulata]|nr:hypothetical protein LTS08_007773 [Lithohypha guttulata]